eukprot:TRINITY_DN5554_c0_g1_i1.p1 TRINITY_DN5554_c0_g1~~TRINITY_DN5554_c0_g1_i1.p1  ORF type:complete len:320 (+),score=58.15 TRINITY_DN5554_c0_g1_i1:421-1380(+)
MPNPFKKVFNGGGKKKKTKGAVSDKNKIFSNKRPVSTSAQHEVEEGHKPPIGSAYLGGYGAHQAEQEDASNYPIRNPYASTTSSSSSATPTKTTPVLPYQPTKPSKLRQSKTAESDEDSADSDVEQQRHNRNKSPLQNILRDPAATDDTQDGLLKFLVRNHSLTALCFGRNADKLDMLRRASLLGFVFLATLLSALVVVVSASISTFGQILASVVILPGLTFGLRVGFAMLRNSKASGVIFLIFALLIDLGVLIGVFWETWTLIAEHGTELWTALFVWAESWATNQILELPGLLWQFFFFRMCCSCIVRFQDEEMQPVR